MNLLLVGIPVVIGSALEVLILHALIKGPYRKYPILFAYVLILLFTGIIDATLYNFQIGSWAGTARKVFWVNDSIRQVVLFVFVLSLVHRAMASGPRRTAVQRLLVIGSIALAVVSYYGFYDRLPSLRMSTVIRNMSFCAAVLNLGLWAALIRRKQRDPQILLLSGGLGMQITGEAMGHSLRGLYEISRIYATVGNAVLVAAHLLCLLVWWQAFRSKPQPPDTKKPFDGGKAKRYTGTFQDASLSKIASSQRPAR